MTLALGCLLHLVGMVVLMYVLDQMTGATVPDQLRPWLALVAAALLTAGLSNVWHLARGYGRGEQSRGALLRRARAGEPPAEEGPMLATGVVRPQGEPLIAPMSGVPCVAYDYRIYRKALVSHDNWRMIVYYAGQASRPFRLDTPTHRFRVLALPHLADEPTRLETDAAAMARAAAYTRTTTFESSTDWTGGTAGLLVTMVGEMYTEQTGDLRRDWKRLDAPDDLTGLRIEETALAVGATASASGRWSMERRAIVPGGLTDGTGVVTVITGPAEGLLGRLGGPPPSGLAVAVGGIVLLGLGAAVVWAAEAGHVAALWARLGAQR